MFNDEIDLTDSERSAFARLPKERQVSDLLEQRVVSELRSRGVLSASRKSNRFTTVAIRTAAAVFIFAAGALTQRFIFDRQETTQVAKPTQVRNDAPKTAQMELWI